MMVRSFTISAVVLSAVAIVPFMSAQDLPLTSAVTKLGVDMDLRSDMRILMDDILAGTVILPDLSNPATSLDAVPQVQLRGPNVQVNVPSGDNVQQFLGFRPFVHATQSEVSTAAFGQNVVLGYNNSAGLHLIPNPSGPGLVVDRLKFSGFASSHDRGQTWNNGFIPATRGAPPLTFGDPSLGVDRHGNFFYANLGISAPDAKGRIHGTITVDASSDGGATWGDGVVVQVDDGSDKEWLAVGRDPQNGDQDNVYVTWTSFQSTGAQLRFGRSIDGGATFTAKTIFTPKADPNPTHPQNFLQFSNPVVDPITGTLYVPFLHFSNADQDFIQMLISTDAGETFHFATFNIPGAPDPTLLPVTQPGELTECSAGNFRLTIHGTLNAGPGRFGFPRYVNASRMTLQPAAAARNGVVYIAWNNSESRVFGSAAGSDVLFIRSDDGGQTWGSPVLVNPAVSTDKHHVLPSLAIDEDPNGVHVSYYTQHTDESIDLDMANSHDRGGSFPSDRTVRVTSTSFHLPPTNIRLTDAPNYLATNYDRNIAQCYALGEYQGLTSANGRLYVGWGDARNTLTEPNNVLDPISGQTHSEEDVFSQTVKAQ